MREARDFDRAERMSLRGEAEAMETAASPPMPASATPVMRTGFGLVERFLSKGRFVKG